MYLDDLQAGIIDTVSITEETETQHYLHDYNKTAQMIAANTGALMTIKDELTELKISLDFMGDVLNEMLRTGNH